MDTTTKSISARVLEIAASQVGVQEHPKGSNSGPEVDEYLKSVLLSAGNPWCMAFVYWCAREAYRECVMVIPLAQTGGVMIQWKKAQLRKVPNRASGVKPGDIFIMQFAHGTGHTGFVESIGNGVIHTIEGNTNDDGSREGYEVARRVRPISSIFGFIQLP